MLRTIFTIVLLPSLCFGQLIDEGVLPFGSYSSLPATYSVYFTPGKLDTMHNSLGINQFVTRGFHDTTIVKRFADAGIYVYPVGFNPADTVLPWEPQAKFSNATYFVCHPESSSYYNVGFNTPVGSNVYQDSLWLYSGSGTMFDDLKMLQRNNYDPLDGTGLEDKLDYYPILKIGAYTSGLADTTIIGIFSVKNLNRDPDLLRFIDTIRVENLPSSGDTTLSLTNRIDTLGLHYYHVLPNLSDSSHQMSFEFETTGACSVYVDYFQVHCQYGKELVDDHLRDTEIYESVSRPGYDTRIRGWFLVDSARRGNFIPVSYIDNLIQDTTSEWSNPVWGPAWLNIYHSGSDRWEPDGFRDFEHICRPKELWAYLYPISLYTSYTGYSSGANLFQSQLEAKVTIPCDSIAAALSDYDTSYSWTYTPQFWYCVPAECTGSETRRKPTPSELLCMTYTGMCYHPKSIIFWKYDSTDGTWGILDENGNPREGMYEVVRDEINPYIKAIDETYLALDWDTAYAINYANGFGTGGTWIDTIYAVSDTPNPDLGWFHVGQFTEGSDKYVMLVNRACSKNEEGDAAPSITATIKFDTGNLGLGDYVYIIDIATGTDSSDWIGTPDTTYSGKMPDGTIPFTTVLGPGEGRLFKLLSAR